MKLALLTDAWQPQVNGVVTTLVELVREMRQRGHEVVVIHPGLFKTRPCPGYPGIDLAVQPDRSLPGLLESFAPDCIHLATEGPIGWAARSYCRKKGLRFTTAFHTRFPEILQAALRIPLSWSYALFRHFHRPSSGVMVPTEGMLHILQKRRFGQLRPWTHGVDLALFPFKANKQICELLGPLSEPVFLYVGRISYEKNIQAFLDLVLPGTKVVCGVGPLEAQLKAHYPHVRWLGVLPRHELAKVYAAADVFVFPSRNETFGLVMLEAMACGTPVAAYPVDGPLEVVGQQITRPGGALHAELQQACLQALQLPRSQARQRAELFDWSHAASSFEANLVPIRGHKPIATSSRCTAA
jgi:glycosyltransferase involved in cell wall biosynthesis